MKIHYKTKKYDIFQCCGCGNFIDLELKEEPLAIYCIFCNKMKLTDKYKLILEESIKIDFKNLKKFIKLVYIKKIYDLSGKLFVIKDSELEQEIQKKGKYPTSGGIVYQGDVASSGGGG